MIDSRQEFTFAKLGEHDRADLQQLAERVGWHFADEQVALLMAAGTVYGLHAAGAGRRELIGASAIYPYGRNLASLGIVMVSPEHQRQGIGTAVVRRCLADVDPQAHVMLIATPQGRPVYESLGFRIVEQVHRYELDLASVADGRRSHVATALRQDDLAAVVALDETASGGRREAAYQALWQIARIGVAVRDDGGHVRGFTFALRGTDRWLMGPVIADSVHMAAELVQAVVERLHTEAFACKPELTGGGTVRLDVPGQQAEFQASLQGLGFQETRQSPVMSFGGKTLPGHRDRMFAMIDPALG
ncbi:GNAT family N-acetyltransferase [Alicyclobacillus sp. ALC3]|uniref:GNAT family N-acetyltransferase n=1 Tax=Alicyclobacillus sp. ALC3 TaxID=2796143 RepID=UPI002378E8D2|nr:GNAT family N-acetyltransferase [Alicyclobacillus sp. ALC3]WDL96430.1 GNAT family N-acetyltransferase [Alicyclobacillus sp. ALC3]